MAGLPVIDTPISSDHLNCQITDISSGTATTSSAYIRVPFRSRIIEVAVTIFGAITSANAVITAALNGTSIGTLTITQSGSAAGNVFTLTPTTLTYANYGDYVSFISDHGSSTACPANCEVALVVA